ncbi:phage tail sheath family protein [Desulforamulus ruminis]|uniref:Phage tail sheath protein n=1 Tax=Desulforamulus ruminis (strain ATCC 23193 / DSM 2154 / NCIMB 8452 / DL) TaxID=696281 RepID=F6DLR3_DESRL|nr:phage tail sheath family protein [Desulforamulus ruminis]AEG61705.1 hypothetical protein Desru_3502 [Desulforamulus ruminis DSM 2154]
MAGGTWSPTEQKVRPGFYLNFEAAALAAIKPGARGIVACPVKADWGPVRDFKEITSEAELLAAYGEDTAAGSTAYKTLRLALLGGAKTVLAYRLADSNAAKAGITLQDGSASPVDVLKLETKYETTRPFKLSVRTNLVDSSKQDILLYNGSALLRTFTFTANANGVDNAVAAINGDAGNEWVTAVKMADGNGALALINSQDFTGGNNGIAEVANADYIAAQSVFEARVWNLFTLDGITGSALQTSFKSWIERLREEGKGVIGVFGGSVTDDADPNLGNQRSLSFNHEGVVNVTVGAVLNGETYASSEVAPYVAGLIAGQKLSESITYAVCPFEDVSPRLTNNQVIAALQSGSLVLVHDGEKVKIEQGINTLTSLRQGQNNQWKKIRAIRTMDAINNDLLKAASDNYIGKVNNNDDGKVALINAFKQYMDTLVQGGIVESDYSVYLNPVYHGNPALAAPDEVYPKWEARITDGMEKIFGTFMVK